MAWTRGQKLGGKNEFRFKDMICTDVCNEVDEVRASLTRQRTGYTANR